MGIGCEYTGCMPYADDVILISTSIIQLQAMLDIRVRFGDEMDISLMLRSHVYLKLVETIKIL